MKRFKQFLIERLEEDDWIPDAPTKTDTTTKVPLRGNFPEGEEGQKEYIQALKDSAPKLKQEAEEFSRNAETSSNILSNVESGLRTADLVTDVALSAASVTPPGAILNAAVKGVKSGIDAKEGDYGSAAINALDAITPGVGKVISGAGKATKLASNATRLVVDPVSSVGKTTMGLIGKATTKSSPLLAQATEKGLKKVGEEGIEMGIDSSLEYGQKVAARQQRQTENERSAVRNTTRL